MSERQAKKERKKQRDGLSLRGDIWWFRRMVNGKRIWISTRYKDRNSARRRAIEIAKDQNDGVFGWKEKPEAVVPTIADYAQTAYEAHYQMQRDGADVLMFHTRLAAAFEGKRLDELTMTECQGYLNERRRLGDSPGYVKQQRTMFRALWNRAIDDGLIATNPWKKVTLSRVLPRTRVMSIEEQKILFPLLAPSPRRAATVALWTGLRNWELCHIERADVDFVLEIIRVRGEITKRNKPRIVPLPAEAAGAIREQMAALDGAEPKLAHSFWGRDDDDQRIFPYKRNTLIKSFRMGVEAAKLPPLTIHDLRRTFGTRLAQSKYPIRKLQKWLGHSDISMTAAVYTNVDEYQMDDLDDAFKKTREALSGPAKVLPISTVTVSIRK